MPAATVAFKDAAIDVAPATDGTSAAAIETAAAVVVVVAAAAATIFCSWRS